MMRAPIVAALLLVHAHAAAQDPASPGPLATSEWDAGGVSIDGASIPTVVLYPSTGGPYPVVGLFHGLDGEGSDYVTLSTTLASHGLVVVRPDMPCRLSGGCDHARNAELISGLLAWAVAQGEPGSMLAGRVDGERRGLVGHSFGALNSHIAASRDATIDSVVLLDPNDDSGTPGRLATPGVAAPTAQLLAARPGSCNSAWSEATITPMLPTPRLELTVAGSGHCDPADVHDAICEFACGAGDDATNPTFRRYAVAWTLCNLTADPAMADWLGGAMMTAEETSGVLTGVTLDGADDLPCRGGTPPPPRDGGPVPETDASGEDAGTHDAAIAIDAGGTVSSGGCGCRAAPRAPGGASALVLLALLALRRR